MNNFFRVAMLVLFIAVVLTGCAGKPIKVGTVDQKIEKKDIDLTKGRIITSSSSGFQLLLFIPAGINGRQANAYQNLLGQAGNDYITNIKIQESWTYAFVGTVYTTTIEATAYPRKI